MSTSTPCPFCDAPLLATARFCPQCGGVLDASALPTVTSPTGATTERRAALERAGAEFAPGAMIGGRYRVVALLGRGGMGEVYRADDLQLGQPVALKFLPVDVNRDPARLEQFLSEVRLARQVSHPNVCRVYDIGESGDRRFLSMEYIDGEDLRSLLRRIGRLPEDKALEISRQIAAGLAAMHDKNIVHRDLKPANVMLDGQGRVRLTDFGLATHATGAGSDGSIAGTPQYMAPEQLAGEPLSPRTDVYALGLVLWEIFTGERVHKETTLAALRDAHQAPTPVSLSSSSGARLDPAVRPIIERCLERDPKRRPASALAVSAALPGGDPIAAALAAGQTPSPQEVAASGTEGVLAPKIAIPCLVALIFLAALTTWLNGRELFGSGLALPNSPEVLEARARDFLVRVGDTATPADTGSGFGVSSDYSIWLDGRDKSPDRLRHFASTRPGTVLFWYRTSPKTMLAERFLGASTAVLTFNDPPLETPGMTLTWLDPIGRIVYFRRMLPDRAPTPAQPITVNWSPLFESAGLDIKAFRPVTPEWLGHTDADTRAAWLGPGADDAGAELRVEAAAMHGTPVFFGLVAPWSRPTEAGDAPTPLPIRIAIGFAMAMLTAVFAAGVALAIRHVRLGRADNRGAARLAIVVGGAAVASGLFGQHYAADLKMINTLCMLIAWGAFAALMTWMFYVAIEPHIRRRWPQVLISWSRLMEGRWRDPLVGRDLLIGSLVSLAIVFPGRLENVITVWRGGPPPVPYPNAVPLSGTMSAIGVYLDGIPASVSTALGLLLLLVVLRIVLRGERAAAIAVLLILWTLDVLSSLTDPLVQIPLRFGADALLVLAATRLGLVGLIAVFFVSTTIFVGNLSFTFPSYLTGAMVAGAFIVLGPGIFGWYTSMARTRTGATWLDA